MIVLQGDQALRLMFNKLKTKVANDALRKGTRAGANDLLPVVRALAPVKTGELRRSIKVRATKRSRVRIGCMVTLTLYYARFQEWGTRFIHPLYYLKKAVETHGQSALDKAATVMKQVIDGTK